MRILFVSSGNSTFGVSPIIKSQGESLIKQGIDIDYYTISGKGLMGYLRNIKPLRKYLQSNKFDIIHAHFSLTAFVAALSGARPLVVSLMGWNVKLLRYKFFIHVFNYFFFDACIVKSKEMKTNLGLKDVVVIPGGIDFNKFYPYQKESAQKELNWDSLKKHVLFAANPNRPIKNFPLAKEAFEIVRHSDENVELHVLADIPYEKMNLLYNACDVVLLTSKAEGSPNVLKEAMACNCKIVTTRVGDVNEYIDNADGCYICNDNADEIAEKLKQVICMDQYFDGRQKVKQFDSESIAKHIISLYNKVLQK